jgi:hypothetical protein
VRPDIDAAEVRHLGSACPAIEPGHVVSRLPPIRSEPLAARGAIATLRTPRAATRQDGTCCHPPSQCALTVKSRTDVTVRRRGVCLKGIVAPHCAQTDQNDGGSQSAVNDRNAECPFSEQDAIRVSCVLQEDSGNHRAAFHFWCHQCSRIKNVALWECDAVHSFTEFITSSTQPTRHQMIPCIEPSKCTFSQIQI